MRQTLWLMALLVGVGSLPSGVWAGSRDAYRPAEIRVVAQRAETIADSFEKNFDRALDATIIDSTKREADAEKAMKKLEKALDDVEKRAGRKKFKAVRKDVRDALEYADVVDGYVRQLPLTSALTNEWYALVDHLDELAYFYELPGIGRGYGRPVTQTQRRGRPAPRGAFR